MRNFARVIFGAFLISVLSGSAAFSAPKDKKPSVETPAPSRHPGQPEFNVRRIKLGGKILDIEIADTPRKREHGLMFRETLPTDGGMLFVFDQQRTLSFWMMNTLIPLSIAYIDRNRKIVDIQGMVPAVLGDTNPRSYPSRSPALYALEMNVGWFKRNNVKVGDVFTFVEGR